MKVFLITQKEMDELREKLRAGWLEHCERYNLKPSLINDPNHHDYDLFAHYNYIYCRWMNEVTGDNPYKELR